MLRLVLVCACCLLCCREKASAAITAVATKMVNNQTEVRSITLDDGRVVPSGDLIGINVTHFRSTDDTSGVMYAGDVTTPPPPGTRAALLEDFVLNTGLLEIGFGTGYSAATPISSTPGLAFAFHVPVVNGRGDDVALFEQHVGEVSGNAILVSRLDGLGPRLTLGPTYQVSSAIASVRFAALQSSPRSLEDLETAPLKTPTSPFLIYRAQGIGFDLDALGYAPGASVSGLFLQSATLGSDAADPVFIAGLPPIPEPSALTACGGGALLLGLLRRRH